MTVDGNQKLKKGALLFTNDFEAEVDFFFGKAGNSLLLYFELFVDLLDVFVELGVRFNFLECMVHSFELDLEDPPFVAEPQPSVGQGLVTNFISFIFLDFEDRKVFEISSAFDQDCVIDLLMNDQVIVAPKDEVDSLHFFCELHVVVLHHMRQGNYHIALVLVPQFDDHPLCKVDKGNVFADFFVVGVESIDPFLFSQAKHTDLDPVLLKDIRLQALGQASLSTPIIDVTEQPGEVCHAGQFLDSFYFVIEIVIPEACQIDPKGVEGLYHVLTIELVGQQCWRKRIARKQCELMLVLLLLSLQE